MTYYQISDIFTLIPQQFYNIDQAQNALQNIFGIGPAYNVQSVTLAEHRAVLCYAIHKDILERSSSADSIYPFVYKLICLIEQSNNYNNAIFHYDQDIKLCHIIICQNKQIKIVNSFKCDNFESAVYFLLLSVKKLDMNPKQTIIRAYSPITPNQKALLNKVFNGVEENILDNSDLI
ncbi:MAG: DUF3822 family protein [Bacteroidia bacterium]|nr:DUF3822 family protein [Bacteroidia bacterium]